MKPMTWFHHRCTHGISDNSRKMIAGVTLLLRRQSCRKKAIWTSAIFLMSHGKVGEQKGPQTSEPYETVGRTKASNKRLIMGKDFAEAAASALECSLHCYKVTLCSGFSIIQACRSHHANCASVESGEKEVLHFIILLFCTICKLKCLLMALD